MSQGYIHTSQPKPVSGGVSGMRGPAMANMTQTATSSAATIRRLYREGSPNEPCSVNIMFDPRVRRGVTTGRPVPVIGPMDKNKLSAKEVREQRAAEKKFLIQTGQIRPTLKSTSELHASIVVPKWRTEVDLSKHLIEQVKPIVYLDKDIQTDPIKESPPTPPFQPRKLGTDQGTQVQNNLVFDFDSEAIALADILITATFDQALIEVREDEEIKNYAAAKLELERKQAAHTKEMNKRVEAERDLTYRKARMAREAQITAAKEASVRQMFAAHAVAQNFLVKLQEDTMLGLARDGFLADPQQRAVDLVFMPWLEERVRERLDLMRGCATALDEIIATGIALESENARACRNARLAAAREQEVADERNAQIAERKRRENSIYRISVHSEFSQRPLGPIEVSGSNLVSDVLHSLLNLLLGEESESLPKYEDDYPADKHELARRAIALKKQKRQREREASRFQLALDRRGTFSESIGSSRSLEEAEAYAASLAARIKAHKEARAATRLALQTQSKPIRPYIEPSESVQAGEASEEPGSANPQEGSPEQLEAEASEQSEDLNIDQSEEPKDDDVTIDEDEDDNDVYIDDFDSRRLVGPNGLLPRGARLCDLPIDPSTQLRLIVAPLSTLPIDDEELVEPELELFSTEGQSQDTNPSMGTPDAENAEEGARFERDDAVPEEDEPEENEEYGEANPDDHI